MLFNSIDFAVFLPIVFAIYWFVLDKKLEAQNTFLLAASYFFYGWWDIRFLLLIVLSSIVDYLIGKHLHKEEDAFRRKMLLGLSLLVNLGILCFFKYYNFFIENFATAFSFFGQEISSSRLNIILPVGISFYTFQTLSYTIDVYRKKLTPSKDIISFFAFVSFFPQLVAGPIERASNLLPQFYKERTFNNQNGSEGLRQILWGLFKKIVIADNCAIYVNDIFGSYQDQSGATLLLAAILFAFQIYGDFSGYSDIAIGTAKLFGFKLMKNFDFPYFSRDIAEFWRRWHISLSTWFRDYLYIPLGGSRGSKMNQLRNVLIIFIVSGFWHGANWTFIFWGLINALLFIPLMLSNYNRNNLEVVAQGKIIPSFIEIFQILLTFFLTTIAWVFFRAESILDAFKYLKLMFTKSLFSMPHNLPYETVLLIGVLLFVEWLQRDKEHGLDFSLIKLSKTMRWSTYIGIIFLILFFGASQQEFIYFKF